jgi:DNA-binding transcriptional ArsR family regulator
MRHHGERLRPDRRAQQQQHRRAESCHRRHFSIYIIFVNKRTAPYHLRERRQLRVLVPPVRQEIVDGVAAIGPCSVAELAALLGRRPTALYHHLARLEQVGLLLREPGASDGRGRPRARYDVPGRPVLVDMAALSVGGRALVEKYVAAMLRNARRGYARAQRSTRPAHAGPRRTLWAASWKGWLSRAELARANQLLGDLIDLLQRGKSGRGRRLMQLTFVLSEAICRGAA